MSTRISSELDPADRTFFNNLFVSVAEEMGVALARTAFSPNIKERRDYSCALFNRDGRLIAQAAHIPVHLGALPVTMDAVRDRIRSWAPGDMVMVNDPFCGGTHLPDITLVSPVFAGSGRGKPFAFLVTRAHHADVGGISPGSLPLSRHIDEEGFRTAPVKLYASGRENRALIDAFLAAVRTPEERRGDLRAQASAHHVGERRLREMIGRYSAPRLTRCMNALIDYAERIMTRVIRGIPDGCYRFADVLDGDGLGHGPLDIRVAISIRGGEARVDFTGSAPSCEGSLNAVEAITRSAVYYGFLCLVHTPSKLLEHAMSEPPVNAGSLLPITVIAPPGSIVNAREPAAVAGGNVETSQRITDVVFGALARALPGIIPAASQGTMNNLTVGGIDPRTGKPFAYYETTGGGMGARPHRDGLDGVQVHMTNTLNTPVEALEYAYPFRIRHYGLAVNTGGAGAHRGGHGIRRELELLCHAEVTLLSERREHAPYGLAGGEDGKPGVNRLVRRGRSTRLPGKVRIEAEPGDVIRMDTPGGGGHGRKG